MNKAQFIDRVKEVGDFATKREAENAVNAFVAAIEESLSKKETVELVGFGKFEIARQKGKEGKVPNSDRTYVTEDKYVPKFKPGKGLRDLIAKIKLK